MIEYYTIIYIGLFLIVFGISCGCLKGRKKGLIVTCIISSIVTAIISSLGFSIYLAFCNSTWEIKEYKARKTEKIDSIKLDNGVITFYGPGDLGKTKVIRSTEKESKVEIYNRKKVTKADKITGIKVDQDIEKRFKSVIYLCESDYEIWKTLKDNRKK